MRIALKIAYLGDAFYGHQRQPDVRTVEGECLRALRAAGIVRDPADAFFRSASRTDRGVSAVGNVIAFDSALPPDPVVGAFNDRAREVWAWGVAHVPDGFHPRHAIERWYRYHLFGPPTLEALRRGAEPFVGSHDFRSFTSDPPAGPVSLTSIRIGGDEDLALVDLRGPSFRRGMVRRIVAAILAQARGDVSLGDVLAALRGTKRDFGSVPAEPLVLMDVRYDIPFRTVLKPKVRDEWATRLTATRLRARIVEAFEDATGSGAGARDAPTARIRKH